MGHGAAEDCARQACGPQDALRAVAAQRSPCAAHGPRSGLRQGCPVPGMQPVLRDGACPEVAREVHPPIEGGLSECSPTLGASVSLVEAGDATTAAFLVA